MDEYAERIQKDLKPREESSEETKIVNLILDGAYIKNTKPMRVSNNSISGTVINPGSVGRLTVGGGFDVYEPILNQKDNHHDKGVCQESYDQGFEDGKKAGERGDNSRIQ